MAYFIPRNNKFYHYIAHIAPRHRYLATLSVVFLTITAWLYFIYYPLAAYTLLYADEHAQLRKKQDDIAVSRQKIKELGSLIDTLKYDVTGHAKSDSDEHFKQMLLFVLQEAQNAGLKINAYNVLGVKDKEWCKKEKIHLDLSGAIENSMRFFDSIQKSQKMITCSNVVLSCGEGNVFTISCDIGMVVVVQ